MPIFLSHPVRSFVFYFALATRNQEQRANYSNNISGKVKGFDVASSLKYVIMLLKDDKIISYTLRKLWILFFFFFYFAKIRTIEEKVNSKLCLNVSLLRGNVY